MFRLYAIEKIKKWFSVILLQTMPKFYSKTSVIHKINIIPKKKIKLLKVLREIKVKLSQVVFNINSY